MKLTGADINKAYSEQLAKLLLDGYTLVVARENGSLEKNKDDYAKVVLEKNGKFYEYGYWFESINRSTGKHTLTLTQTDNYKYSRWSFREEVDNLLSEPYSYYSYVFELGGEYEPYKYFTFSTEKEALELYEKRKQRSEYHAWENQGVINTFKVAKTNFKGFKTNVTVESLRYNYRLINKNGRKASVKKGTGYFAFY